MSRGRRVLPLLVLCAFAPGMLTFAGCGQKGPLFLPDREKTATPPPRAPEPAAAPESEKPKEDEAKRR